MTNRIIGYQPQYGVYFERLNKDWLEEYFSVEPIDKYVLENPEEAILNHGGEIMFAESDQKITGTVALKWVEPGVYELTKMAVEHKLRGLGTGKMLCAAAIQKAKDLGATKLILYSSRRLENAIGIYLKLGFSEIPIEPGLYQRADIKMEMILK